MPWLGYSKSKYTSEEDKQDGTKSAGTILSSAGTGAAAGAQVAGPWGALIGGAVGLGAGSIKAGKDQEQDIAAREQQAALEAALNDNSLAMALQQQAIAGQQAKEQNVAATEQLAATMGLSPGDTARLMNQAAASSDMTYQQNIPGAILQARQAELVRKQGVLAEFTTAQDLMNNATTEPLGPEYAQAAGALAQLGEMNNQQVPEKFQKFGGADPLTKNGQSVGKATSPSLNAAPALPAGASVATDANGNVVQDYNAQFYAEGDNYNRSRFSGQMNPGYGKQQIQDTPGYQGYENAYGTPDAPFLYSGKDNKAPRASGGGTVMLGNAPLQGVSDAGTSQNPDTATRSDKTDPFSPLVPDYQNPSYWKNTEESDFPDLTKTNPREVSDDDLFGVLEQ